MHIINLTLECKEAKGDGTIIVCMNRDYRVRIHPKDCGTFTNAPVKKLIVRHKMEYLEADIVQVEENGETYLQAILPPIERKDYVDLGVCGREEEDPTSIPTYTSKSARFSCDKSILCGTAVIKTDPILSELAVTESGTYLSSEQGADGFYKVDVQIASKAEENRTVALSMLSGDQVILPSNNNSTLSQVVIVKPIGLVPRNIKNGVNIGGVVGIFEDSALPIEIQTGAEMEELLETGKPGEIYKYVGPTSNTFKNGGIYIIEVEE